MVILTVKPVRFFNLKFVVAITVASLGAFQHGYHTGVLNITYMILLGWANDKIVFDKNKELGPEFTHTIFHMSVSFFYLGGFVGALFSMVYNACLGPKTGIILNSIAIFVGILMMALCNPLKSFPIFFVGRIWIGIGVGVNSVLIPMYLVEIAPTNLRGCVGCFYQVFSAFGMMMSLSMSIPQVLGNKNWSYLFVVPLLPLVIQMCTLPMCPESPRYLFIVKDKPEKAENNLYWLRNSWNVDLDMEEIYDEAAAIGDMPSPTFAKMFELKCYRSPLLISIMTMAGQQLTGFLLFYGFSQYILIYYLEEIGKYYLAAIVGCLALGGACCAPLLIEVCGRRNLLMSGYMGVIFSTLFFAICLVIENALQTHMAVFFMYTFVFMFETSISPIAWIYPHEIFAQNARAKGAAMAASVNWLLGFTIVMIFIPLSVVCKSFIFWLFVVFDVIFYVLTYLLVPETRCRSGAEVLDIFQ